MTIHTPSTERREQWLAVLDDLDADIEPQTVRLLERMRMVSHAMYQLSEQNLEVSGLSYARFRLLMNLYMSQEIDGRCELNPSEISDKQGISRNTVSALIRDLEEEGLIERRLDQEDRRRFNIRLTQDGRARFRAHAAHHFHTLAATFDVLDEQEQAELNRLLGVLGASIELTRERISSI
jgi:DNA-binding MarR family transcriptional regulator